MELKPGEYTIEVLIHFETNQNRVSIQLPAFEHLRAVYLCDYQVVNPLQIFVPQPQPPPPLPPVPDALVQPLVIRLNLGVLQPSLNASNVGGIGHAMIINGTTRVSYDRPRVISNQPRTRFNQLTCELGACVDAFAAPLEHSGATFSLLFVCHSGKWSPEENRALTLADPHSTDVPYSTSRKWM